MTNNKKEYKKGLTQTYQVIDFMLIVKIVDEQAKQYQLDCLLKAHKLSQEHSETEWFTSKEKPLIKSTIVAD